MGTNKGKLKKQKQAANKSHENRRKQLKAAPEPTVQVSAPATDRELQALAERWNKGG